MEDADDVDEDADGEEDADGDADAGGDVDVDADPDVDVDEDWDWEISVTVDSVGTVLVDVVEIGKMLGSALGALDKGGPSSITARSGVRSPGTGIAAFVVVIFAGSYASTGIAFGFNGQIPHFANADMMVDDLNARCRAV